MDAYSMSYTTPSCRGSSRVYQDLAAYRSTTQTHTLAWSHQSTMETSQKTRRQNSTRPPKVGIVGAGISGLRCADILLQQGFDVTILEGRDRIGGRTHQATLSSGHLVDVGPNWIHGTDHNPILDLAKKTDTPTHTWGEQVNIFEENGKILKDGSSLSDAMWGIIVQAFQYSAQNTSSIKSEESLHHFFLQKVKHIFPGKDEDEQKQKIVMQMSELWGAFVGSPIQRQSLKFFWLEECIDGENLFCAGTYENILAMIAQPALEKASIKLSSKITSFKSHKDGITLCSEDGTELEFDEVVMTAPLGWMKLNKTVFEPPLPARLLSAIDSIGYGSLEKVYISFPRAFWLTKDGKSEEQFTGFTQWLSPSYARDTNPHLWNQEAVDLATLPGTCSHPTLLYYIFGDQSVALSEQLAALPSAAEKQAHITKFFRPYFSLLPHYDEKSHDCIPVSSLATNWVTDELAGYGSYSTFRVGLQEGDKDIEVMREGLPERGLWFAGEHTAPFVALGTVTGAYWSGEAVGKRIADAYGKNWGKTGDMSNLHDVVGNEEGKEVNIRGFADKALEN